MTFQSFHAKYRSDEKDPLFQAFRSLGSVGSARQILLDRSGRPLTYSWEIWP